MRGPLHALWNSRLIGTYLQFRVGFLLAGILAVVAASIVLGIGGLWGMLALFGVVSLALLALGILLVAR